MLTPENKSKKKITEKKLTKRKIYTPPKAILIPLKIEERLMYCNKEEGFGCTPTKFS